MHDEVDNLDRATKRPVRSAIPNTERLIAKWDKRID